MDPLDELWRHIRLSLVSGFRLRLSSLGLGLWLGRGFRRSCVSFGLRLRFSLGFRLWFSLGFRRRCVSFGLRLRFSLGFRLWFISLGLRLRRTFSFIIPN